MNILVLAPYPPFPPHGGGAQRIYQFIRGLSTHHQITCLAFVPDEAGIAAMEPLRDYCRLEVVIGPESRSLPLRALTTLASPLPDMALRNASPHYEQRLRSLLALETFDLVQAESIEMARYLLAVSSRRTESHRPKLVLDQFNAEYLLQQRAARNDMRQPRRLHAAAYSLAQWQKLAAYERRVMKAVDATIVVSEEDRRALLRLAPHAHTALAPNGVDCRYFAPQPRSESPKQGPLLVFSGTMDYRPNVDAARWFVAEVLPLVRAQRPDARLRLVGRSPAPAVLALAANPAVEVTGPVPDARPHIAAADVYIVPMRIGGGVRLKLLEALAMEAPVVSTSLGAEGVAGLLDGTHCLLADTPQTFARAVLRLLDTPESSHRLGSAGRRLVQTAYDWSVIVPRLETLYTAI